MNYFFIFAILFFINTCSTQSTESEIPDGDFTEVTEDPETFDPEALTNGETVDFENSELNPGDEVTDETEDPETYYYTEEETLSTETDETLSEETVNPTSENTSDETANTESYRTAFNSTKDNANNETEATTDETVNTKIDGRSDKIENSTAGNTSEETVNTERYRTAFESTTGNPETETTTDEILNTEIGEGSDKIENSTSGNTSEETGNTESYRTAFESTTDNPETEATTDEILNTEIGEGSDNIENSTAEDIFEETIDKITEDDVKPEIDGTNDEIENSTSKQAENPETETTTDETVNPEDAGETEETVNGETDVTTTKDSLDTEEPAENSKTSNQPETIPNDIRQRCEESYWKILNIPYPFDCSKYVTCHRGLATVWSCPYKLEFNSILGTCVLPEFSTCPKNNETTTDIGSTDHNERFQGPSMTPTDDNHIKRICRNNRRKTFYTTHPEDPLMFVFCRRGHAFIGNCGNYLVWCPKSNRCIWPHPPGTAETNDSSNQDDDDNSDENNDLAEICEAKRRRFNVPYPSDCSKYIHCRRGEATVKSCPNDLLWNSNFNKCVSSNIANCKHQESRSDTIDPYSETANNICKENPWRVYLTVFPSDCSKYILCNRGVGTVKSCPDSLRFRESSKNCVFWLYANCN